jgi:hypothetical protein
MRGGASVAATGDDHRERAACYVLVALALAIGLTPHVAHSIAVGRIEFFFGAWDEDFYGLRALTAPFSTQYGPNRFASEAAFTALVRLTNSVDAAYILADALFPTIILLLAYASARRLFGRWGAFAGALFLVAATDLLCCGHIAIVPFEPRLMAWMRQLPMGVRTLFVDNYSTFLYVTRTPEPQVSWVALYGLLAALFHFDSRLPAVRVAAVLGAACVAAATPFLYAPIAVTVPALLLTGAVIQWLVAQNNRDRRWALMLVLLLALSLSSSGIVIAAIGAGASGGLFASRLPILAPSVVIGIFGLGWAVRHWAAWKSEPAFFWWAAAGFAYPVFILNQQIVTGTMTQPHLFERTTS